MPDESAEPTPPTVLRGVELARPGTYDLSSGPAEFTEQMLADAADYYHATGRGAIPLGLGHVDQRFDGEPSFGWVENVRLHTDTRGPVLLGDLVDLPDWLAAEAPKRWRNRSIEGFRDVVHAGRTYTLALTRLALLGATPPGIPSISSLSDLRSALAASTRIAASIRDPDPPPEPQTEPSDPAPAGPVVEPSTEGAGMDPAKIREALGLKPDASDDDVKAALAAAGLTPAPAPPPVVDPPPTPVTGQEGDKTPKPVELPADAPQSLAAAAAAHGAVVLDRGVWEQAQEQIKEGVTAARKLREQERDKLLGDAVGDGRIPPANRDYWAKLWDTDPKGTSDVVASLRRNLVPVQATGYMGSASDDEPDPYESLFPPEQPTAGKGR